MDEFAIQSLTGTGPHLVALDARIADLQAQREGVWALVQTMVSAARHRAASPFHTNPSWPVVPPKKE